MIPEFTFSPFSETPSDGRRKITSQKDPTHIMLPRTKISEISERLKVLILFALSQQYILENQLQRVYLMNPNWFNQFKYKEIESYIKSKYNKIYNSWTLSYDINSIKQIIPLLNGDKLKNFEQNIGSNIQNNWIASYAGKQFQNKYINLYENFVLINDKMFRNFQNYFKTTPTNDEILYIHKKGEGDFIIMKNLQYNDSQKNVNYQNTILIGIINKEKNEFEIKHVLDYDNKNILENEMKMIIQNSLQNYFYDRTALFNNDISSLIFADNKIIGDYYRYDKNTDNTNFINYQHRALLSNNKLWTEAYLYINEISLRTKLGNTNIIDQEFYFVKKEAVTNIKEDIKYEQLNRYFEGKLDYNPPDIKKMYSIVKPLSQNELVNLSNNLNQPHIPRPAPNSYVIDISPIPNPNNPNELFYILKDFELFEVPIGTKYLRDYPYHILKCSLVGNNKIIFHYPINKFNNKYYMFLISTIDENDNFINEHLIIYTNPSYIQFHFNKIKYNINKYIARLAFANNVAPIVVNGYVEIGFVIELSATKEEITLYFKSGDQSLSCAVLCKETDIFNTVVNKLFIQKPEFKENFNYFLCGGTRINEYKSIRDNKIKDGAIILMYHDE